MKKRIAAALLLLSMILLTACGESPAPEVTPTPAPDAAPEAPPTPTPPTPEYIERPALSEPSGVFTDWSKLTEYTAPEEVYTRLSPEPLTELRPDDYGLLLPFVGERSMALDGGWTAGSKSGLVTAEGCIVLDAVCDSIRIGEFWVGGNFSYQPYYTLERTFYEPDSPEANDYNMGRITRYAVCALDGSWCTDFVYDSIYAMPEGFACVLDGKTNLLEAYDLQGGRLFDTADWPLREKLEGWSIYDLSLLTADKYCPVRLVGDDGEDPGYGYVNAKGELLETEYDGGFEQAYAFSEGLAAVRVDGKWGYIDENGDWAVEPSYRYDYYELSSFKNGRALVSGNGRSLLIDKSGRELASVEEELWCVNYGAYPVYCSHDDGTYYDENLQPILIEGKRATSFCEAGVYVMDSDDITLRRPDGVLMHFPDAPYVQYSNGMYIVQGKAYDAEQRLILETDENIWIQAQRDALTGEVYLFANRSVYTSSGEKLLGESSGGVPVGGLFQCGDSTTVGYKNTQNEWVFRIRLDSGD